MLLLWGAMAKHATEHQQYLYCIGSWYWHVQVEFVQSLHLVLDIRFWLSHLL